MRTKGHGRIETRTLTTTTWLNDYLDWPEVGQAFRLTRERRVKGITTVEVVYGITSQGRMKADATRLLERTRSHWGIENGLHYTRDETLGEDRCRVRRGNAPRVLASLRNVAVHILRGIDAPSRAAATRELSVHPEEALRFLLHPGSTAE
jgi:hypothetical protein